jgi:poly-gamma-glutamate synthesis protein (capsule biosynthesis protein)
LRNLVKAGERIYDPRFYAGGENGVLVFNFHPSVVADVKAGGFHIVSTANNHAADRGALGIERTIDELEAANLAFTGTRRRHESEFDRPWSTVTRTKGFNIAWLACSYDLNGMPDPHAQALVCYGRRGEPRAEVLDEIRRLAADPSIAAVILTPHWGAEYTHRPAARERRLAREAIEAGADAVIGAHPHVLQPWEKHVAADGREGLIIYSLGNFISGQMHVERRSGLIALLEFARPEAGKARLAAAGYVPTWVRFGAAWRVVENTGKDNAHALTLTKRLLPPENHVLSSEMAELPKECGVAVASRRPAPGEAQRAQAARASEVTGSIEQAATKTATRSRKPRAKSPEPQPLNSPWLWWWQPQQSNGKPQRPTRTVMPAYDAANGQRQ